ncbi:MAG TPA: hypothetical protein VE075_11160 [Thermoanaerobaculia bacterium]|nr:hypothetical protein [Thermoanaerobaculia bacterium]
MDELGQGFVGGRRLALPEAGEDRLAGHDRSSGLAEQDQQLVDQELAGDLAAIDRDHLPGGIDFDLRKSIAHALGSRPHALLTRGA